MKFFSLTLIFLLLGCVALQPASTSSPGTNAPQTETVGNPSPIDVTTPNDSLSDVQNPIAEDSLIVYPWGDYYGDFQSLSGEELKQHLHLIIRNHKRISYEKVWEALEFTDQCSATEPNVILIYSMRSQAKFQRDRGTSYNYAANGYTLIDSWNREHLWPKSHGFPNETDTAYTDLHHLRPADRSINSARNTRSFDFSDEVYLDNGGTVPTPCKTSRTQYSWEPPDAVKGDIARMMFYMVVRYEGPAYDLELVDFVVPNNNKLPILGKLSTLLQWHQLDPVDQQERTRNEIIFTRYQGNRNPFVDHPEFVNLIWR